MEGRRTRVQSIHRGQPVQRVLQLDAQRLDEELQTLFENFITRALRGFRHVAVAPFARLEKPEIRLFLRFLQYANTIHVHQATPGNALQNLTFVTSSGAPPTIAQRGAHLVCDVVAPYMWTRLRARSETTHGTRRVLGMLGGLHAVLNLVNHIVFLRRGMFATLTHRIAGTRVAYMGRPTSSRASFQLMDHQLVWQGVAELALCLAPLMRQLAATRLSRLFAQTSVRVHPVHRNSGVCFECKASPVMPHLALPCRCVGCFVCLQQANLVSCSACGTSVTGLQRVEYEL